jgi:uncharacterized protein YgiM (DUF1202 family)
MFEFKTRSICKMGIFSHAAGGIQLSHIILYFSLSFIALTAFAGDLPLIDSSKSRHFIIGSLVNVRSAPSINAPIVGRLVVNTSVKIKDTTAGSGFCEISYELEKTGYIVCRLIGNEPIAQRDIGDPFDQKGNPNPLYSATKAFWLKPSVDNLLAAGKHFEALMLKPGEFDAEQKAAVENGRLTKIRRFAIPEFEAMKNFMRNGVKGFFGVTQNETYRLSPKWKEIKKIASSDSNSSSLSSEAELINNLHPMWGLRSTPMELIRALELPPTKSSYFVDAGHLLPPHITTETASAQFDIPYRAIVTSGPKWIPAGHYNDGYVFGAWDVGAIETNLVSEVKKHTLHRDGRILSETSSIPGGRYPDVDADGDSCNLGYSWGDAGDSINRAVFGSTQTNEKTENRLFYFYSKQDLPRAQAKVIRAKKKFSSARFIAAETLAFDIDGDGVSDIFVWEGTGISEQEIHDPGSAQANYRMVFVNISGEWHLFLVDEFLYGCGC